MDEGEKVLKSLANSIMHMEHLAETKNAATAVEEGRFNANEGATPKNFIDSMKNINTRRKTNCDVNLLRKYCDERDIEFENIEDKILLDNVLSGFFLSVKKKGKGGHYEPDSLTSLFGSFQRYFSEEKGYNLKVDKEFKQTRDTISSRRKQLKEMGLGNHKNRADPFDGDEITKLWEAGELGMGKHI